MEGGWRKSGGTALVAAHVPAAVVVGVCLASAAQHQDKGCPPLCLAASPPASPPAAVFLLLSFVLLFNEVKGRRAQVEKVVIKSSRRRHW